VFKGNGDKIVYGMCINDCSGTGSNIDKDRTLDVLLELQVAHPDHGGMVTFASLSIILGASSSCYLVSLVFCSHW